MREEVRLLVEQAIRGVLAQGRPSVDPNARIESEVCRYRNADGCKCAAGQIIPDDKYHPDMEGRSFTAIASGLHLSAHAVTAITHLQSCHDHAAMIQRPSPGRPLVVASPEEFVKRFREEVATRFSDYPELLALVSMES